MINDVMGAHVSDPRGGCGSGCGCYDGESGQAAGQLYEDGTYTPCSVNHQKRAWLGFQTTRQPQTVEQEFPCCQTGQRQCCGFRKGQG